MVEISENLRNLINADSRSFKARLINGENIYEQIASLRKSVVFPSSSMSIGNAICACLECTISDIPVSIAGKKIQAEIAVQGSEEWIKLGSFTAQKPTVTRESITFTAYDAMEKASNYTYRSTLGDGAHTAEEYFEDICKLLNESFVKLDVWFAILVIPEDKLSGYSCRDALAYLAGFLGKNCIVNRDGLFEMTDFKVVDYDMLNIDRIAEPELSDADSIIGFLACCIDEETTLQSGTGSKGFEFISPPMTQERLDELYNQLCGETSAVRVYKAGRITQLLGDPTIDICDVISLNYEDEEHIIPIMSLVFDFDGGLQAEIESFELAEPNSLSLGERLSFEQKQAKDKTKSYINAMAEFSQAIQKAYGVSYTVIDGITYFHDTEKITDAEYIYCLTSNGMAFSDSWGGSHKDTVWKYGIDKTGEAVLSMLKVFHIKADLIEAGRITSANGSTYFDLDNNEFALNVKNEAEEVFFSAFFNSLGFNSIAPCAIGYVEFFENGLTQEQKDYIESEISKIDNPVLKSAMKASMLLGYWALSQQTGFFVESTNDGEKYVLHYSGNKLVFTKYPEGVEPFSEEMETVAHETSYGPEGVTSTKDLFLKLYDKDSKKWHVVDLLSDGTVKIDGGYLNPPMKVNTEYLTAERYDGKSVYVKLIDFGKLPNASEKSVPTGIDGRKAFDMKFDIHMSNGQLTCFPYVSTAFESITRVYLEAGGDLVILTKTDLSAYTAKVTVKYTKS